MLIPVSNGSTPAPAQGGVLFSMAPWRNPLSVKRVWCLFEALTALSISSDINLLTDPFDSTAKVDTLLPLFTRVGVPQINGGGEDGSGDEVLAEDRCTARASLPFPARSSTAAASCTCVADRVCSRRAIALFAL